jgi:hypothetical protein
MNSQTIECLGCHKQNVASAVFCSYCSRKIQVSVPAQPKVAQPVQPAPKRHWWQKLGGKAA